jgi:sialate O-acetylesterase
MIHCARLAGGRVRGVLWYQGESDCGTDELALSYADRFCAAVTAWRDALETPNLPVLTVQLNRVYDPLRVDADRTWTIVRDAQRLVPERIDGVFVVPAIDLPLSDLIHISPAGNMLLGERLAHTALGGVYGRPITYRAPTIRAARQAGDTIVLQFDDVTSRMDTIDATAIAFRIEDSSGVVPIAAVTYPGDSTILLAVGRSLMENAVVHGGYGQAPATVPLDIERLMPMLGFWAVPITSGD